MKYRPQIIRVWGKADSFDVEFTHIGGTRWEASVPPDTNDGQYAVEIWAVNEFSEIAHWTGELYMCNGVCHLKFKKQPYQMWIKKNNYTFDFKKSNTDLIIEKGCHCA